MPGTNKLITVLLKIAPKLSEHYYYLRTPEQNLRNPEHFAEPKKNMFSLNSR